MISTQEKGIYPALERRGVSTRAPWRMMAGMVIASAAFVVAGLLDLRVDGGERVNVAVSVGNQYAIELTSRRWRGG